MKYTPKQECYKQQTMFATYMQDEANVLSLQQNILQEVATGCFGYNIIKYIHSKQVECCK